MIIVVGASASGKTELVKILYQAYGYKKCITTTTRNPRVGEVDGRDYHFVSNLEFDDLVKNEAFVEVTAYHDNRYGLQKKDVLTHGIVIVDPSGANHLAQELKSEVFIVFVQTSEETRRERMLLRGDNVSKIKERLILDRDYYSIDQLNQINLMVHNQNEPLENLAQSIYQAHQAYLNAKA